MKNLKNLSLKEREIYEKLKEVRDPELGFSIVEANLVDEIDVKGGKVRILFHLTMPFCPFPFALQIGREIKMRASEVPGIKEVEVRVQKHVMENEINKTLQEMGNESEEENLGVPKM